jgi:hypothetical protein
VVIRRAFQTAQLIQTLISRISTKDLESSELVFIRVIRVYALSFALAPLWLFAALFKRHEDLESSELVFIRVIRV